MKNRNDLLIAKWRVCVKIHSFLKKGGRPWRPRTRNIVPWYTVPPLLSGPLGTLDPSLDDWDFG